LTRIEKGKTDKAGKCEKLVGQRIEKNTEVTLCVETAGDVPVNKIRSCGNKKDYKTDSPPENLILDEQI
jgi:hypothetical protein